MFVRVSFCLFCDLKFLAVTERHSIAAVTLVIIYFLAKRLQGKNSKRSTKPGTVLLHQFAPSDLVPSGSPPCLKLETFLRMTKIPYENEYGMTFSKKGKMPWIEFNGREIADSNFRIRFLMKEFRVDVDSHLNLTERAIGHTVRTMLEENTYWWGERFSCWCFLLMCCSNGFVLCLNIQLKETAIIS